MKKANVKLTLAECEHLLSLLQDNESQGSYYGPKAQYWNRAGRIKAAIMMAIYKR